MADSGGGGGDDASGGGGGGGGEGLPQLEEDMEARIKRSEARAERSRKRGSLGMELVRVGRRRGAGCCFGWCAVLCFCVLWCAIICPGPAVSLATTHVTTTLTTT